MFKLKIESKEVTELKEKIKELNEELAKVRLDKEIILKRHEAELELIQEENDIKLCESFFLFLV